MQHARVRTPELARVNAVMAELQKFTVRAVRLIHPPYLFIGRILQRIDPLTPEHLHDQAVEVLGSGSHDDLRNIDMDAPAPLQVARDALAEVECTLVRRALHALLRIFRQHAPHRPCEAREGKLCGRRLVLIRRRYDLRLGQCRDHGSARRRA